MTESWLDDKEIDGIPVARRSGMRKGMFDLKPLENDWAVQVANDEWFEIFKDSHPREYGDLEWDPTIKF